MWSLSTSHNFLHPSRLQYCPAQGDRLKTEAEGGFTNPYMSPFTFSHLNADSIHPLLQLQWIHPFKKTQLGHLYTQGTRVNPAPAHAFSSTGKDPERTVWGANRHGVEQRRGCTFRWFSKTATLTKIIAAAFSIYHSRLQLVWGACGCNRKGCVHTNGSML